MCLSTVQKSESRVPDAKPAEKGRTASRQLRGVAASSGEARGRCLVLAGPEDLDRLEDGVIAVCETLFYDLIPFIPRLGGLVTELGGALATVLDYARQFGVPAVVGVKGLMETVRDGETLWVDADFGVIAVI